MNCVTRNLPIPAKPDEEFEEIIKDVNKISSDAATEIIQFCLCTNGKPITSIRLVALLASTNDATFKLERISDYIGSSKEMSGLYVGIRVAIKVIISTLKRSVLQFDKIKSISAGAKDNKTSADWLYALSKADDAIVEANKEAYAAGNYINLELKRNPRISPAINLVISAFYAATSVYCRYGLNWSYHCAEQFFEKNAQEHPEDKRV